MFAGWPFPLPLPGVLHHCCWNGSTPVLQLCPRCRNDRRSNERRFIVALTQEEIASMTNTSRETVSRVLHQFQQEKLISIKGAAMTILQPQALEQLAV